MQHCNTTVAEGERKRGERREGEENEIHVTGKTLETGARGYIIIVISNPQVISISNFTSLPFLIFILWTFDN